MLTFITIVIGVAGLLLTMLGLIAKQDDNREIRRILAWAIFVLITLLLPSLVVTGLTMWGVASILAPTGIDFSPFASQVSWWIGGTSIVYPVIWGVWLYPIIRNYIEEKILASPKKAGKADKRK